MWGETQATNNTQDTSGWGQTPENTTGGGDAWGQSNQAQGAEQFAQGEAAEPEKRGGGRGRGRGRGRGGGDRGGDRPEDEEREKYTPVVSDGWFKKKQKRTGPPSPVPENAEVIEINSDNETALAVEIIVTKPDNSSQSPQDINKTNGSLTNQMELEIVE